VSGRVSISSKEGPVKRRILRLVRPKIIHREGKHSVVDIGQPIKRKEIKAALAEFP
jgi:hypothetical protein